MKIFCPQCGFKNEYVGKKPNFCSSCGSSLNSLDKQENSAKIEEQAVANEEILDDEDYEDEYVEIPNIDSLKFDLYKGESHKRQTLGSLLNNPNNNSSNQPAPRDKSP